MAVGALLLVLLALLGLGLPQSATGGRGYRSTCSITGIATAILGGSDGCGLAQCIDFPPAAAPERSGGDPLFNPRIEWPCARLAALPGRWVQKCRRGTRFSGTGLFDVSRWR
jgi:hypothetical protein